SLKKILPVALVGFVSSFFLKMFYGLSQVGSLEEPEMVRALAEPVMDESVEEIALEGAIQTTQVVSQGLPLEYAWIAVTLLTIIIVATILVLDIRRSKK
ncbi:MAG: hypothetical protein Q8Q35_00320, partial [Nanoarchaeota archaeon]|nr:hypothetical protein [Nanoarchaeota archaeon]